METILVGGLGGGDSGGALPIALQLNKLGFKVVIASFVGARERDIHGARKVTNALLEIAPSSSSPSVRFFEPAMASLGYKTYCICLRESRNVVMEAMKWLIDKYKPKATIHVDMGGDSLLFGDEPYLGSWEEDMLALSILAKIKKRGLIKTYLAVGVLGGEEGGKIPQQYLAENLVTLMRDGAYYGYFVPEGRLKEQTLEKLSKLLTISQSTMLSLYLDSLRGFVGMKEYHVLYLQGKYAVKDYYKYHFFFDTEKVCRRSKLCRQAMRQKKLGQEGSEEEALLKVGGCNKGYVEEKGKLEGASIVKPTTSLTLARSGFHSI